MREKEAMTLVEKSARNKRIKSNIGTTIAYIGLIVLAIIWLYPILWIVLQSFRAVYRVPNELYGIVTSNYLPQGYGLDVYKELFTNTQFPRWFLTH
jgi:arabinogalactan oligomer/maltooligosaccharide transport system permease protein